MYALLFAEPIVDRDALRVHAREEVFGSPLIRLNFWQLRREADFRFGLMRLRENAESIAFYGGEDQERHQLQQRLRVVEQ